MILINGDSFTAGEELRDHIDAWPYQLKHSIMNCAQPGFSNDAILRTTVQTVELLPIEYAIIAWTTPNRIEVNGWHLTPTSNRKYGPICDKIFLDWDEEWAHKKFLTQVKLLDSYLRDKKISYVFLRTFDVPDTNIGNWVAGSMVEWMGECPKGSGGHPLELGHKRIADKVYEYIRNLGWIS